MLSHLRRFTLGIGLALLTAPAAGQSSAGVEQWADGIVARVNGRPILLSDLIDTALAMQLPVGDLAGAGARDEGFRRAITAAIDEELLVQQAIRDEVQIDETDSARRVDLIIQLWIEGFPGGETGFIEFLGQSQLGWQSFRRLMLERERRKDLAAAAVGRRLSVTAQEIEAFRQRRAEAGEPVEQVFLDQIVVLCPIEDQATTRGEALFAQAVALAQEAGREPERFGELARQFSRQPVGWIDPGDLRDELREAVGAMRTQQISEPIRTDVGYHVLNVAQRRTARDLLFAEKFTEVRTKLLLQLRETETIMIDPRFAGGGPNTPSEPLGNLLKPLATLREPSRSP